MKNPSNKCSCIQCRKEYSHFGIDTHYMRSHGSQADKNKFSNSAAQKHKLREYNINQYNKSPKNCKQCNSGLQYEVRTQTFCNSSCAASYNNTVRGPRSMLTKQKISNALAGRVINSTIPRLVGPHTKISWVKCKFCTTSFYNIIGEKKPLVCSNCQHLKYNKNKDQWSFKFNVYEYPDLFNLVELAVTGWCSFGGKRSGKKNLTGMSRDHRVSINEAKKNGYDPYYISHPCNCELMTMVENNKKKTNSSITYKELIQLVDNYDESVKG